MKILTQKELTERLLYDEKTGVFVWRKTGSVAGGLCGNGYIQIRISTVRYSAHRLAWLYVYGVTPALQIDHINRVKTDNRISNLRLATRSQNMINTPPPTTNKTGVKGVSYCKKARKYRARCWVNQKRYHLGWFDSIDDAASAYKDFAIKHYGAFAVDGRGSAA